MNVVTRAPAPALDPAFAFRPGMPGNLWPAVPDARVAQVAALLTQLGRTQWRAPERIAALQFRQLSLAVAHAARTVPAAGPRLAAVRALAEAGRLDADAWSRVAPVSRAEIQRAGERTLSTALPATHGPVAWVKTSGSTGIPLRVATTSATRLFWDAFTLRDHLWHRRDLRRTLGAIRFLGDKEAQGPDGVRGDTWGPPADPLFVTGRSAALHIENDVGAQLDWLARERPDILLTYPSNAVELVREARRRGAALPPLRELRLFSEVVDDATRALLREAFGVPVTDTYSSNECGYVALQCPEHGRYHVQSENLLVEVLDDAGRPCTPGQVGRVVVSTLHNLAMPLLRYESGDHAEVAPPCGCGRGLPALARILGRTRNMLVAPDGRRHWPVIGFSGFREVAPVVQHQLVQTERDHVEVRLVVERPVTPDEQALLAEKVLKALKGEYRLTFSYVDRIERSPVGKYEEFRSLVA